MLVIAIPHVFSQEDIDNSQAINLEQELNQLSPEQQKMMLPFLQKAAQKAIMEAPPEEQELIIQQMKQIFPPQLLEKLLPAEKR
ncbi:MAG TPA: hypothetical protein VHJ38_12220 [Nitrososphaeraceae archaeon]|jgi:hypothetical protein|nr:hypothetical protein [Nitrososphaeraceae archaeon]